MKVKPGLSPSLQHLKIFELFSTLIRPVGCMGNTQNFQVNSWKRREEAWTGCCNENSLKTVSYKPCRLLEPHCQAFLKVQAPPSWAYKSYSITMRTKCESLLISAAVEKFSCRRDKAWWKVLTFLVANEALFLSSFWSSVERISEPANQKFEFFFLWSNPSRFISIIM